MWRVDPYEWAKLERRIKRLEAGVKALRQAQDRLVEKHRHEVALPGQAVDIAGTLIVTSEPQTEGNDKR